MKLITQFTWQSINVSQADNIMEVTNTFRRPQFARSLTAQIYGLCQEENPLTSDLTIVCGDGALHTQSLTLLAAFPYLRQLVR